MRIIIKQTALLLIFLIVVSLVTASIFFVFIKKSEEKNRLALISSINKEIEIIDSDQSIIATSTTESVVEEIKDLLNTSTPEKENEKQEVAQEVEKEGNKTTTSTLTTATTVNFDKVLWDVPFVSQAPFGDWADPKQEAGCEETSLLMAVHWITSKPLNSSIALKEIIAMSDYELKHYGNYYDSSIIDTLKLFKDYFGYSKAYVKYDIVLDDIKKALKNENVVQIPVVGTLLGNPYFTPPGPPVHQILLIGYDDEKGEFIANDPGTRHGERYHYKYSTIMSAIRDYPTGYNEINKENIKAMLVIAKKQD